ncbi:hypothetical protein Tco_0410714 [Tanacetum coccineum]
MNPMLNLPILSTNRSQPSMHNISHMMNQGLSLSCRPQLRPFKECLINNSGSNGTQLMNSQQKLVLTDNLNANTYHGNSHESFTKEFYDEFGCKLTRAKGIVIEKQGPITGKGKAPATAGKRRKRASGDKLSDKFGNIHRHKVLPCDAVVDLLQGYGYP